MQHDLIAAIVSANPSDSLRDDATYELRPRLALDSRLTLLPGGHDVGICEALPELSLPLPGLPALPTQSWQRWRLFNAGGGYYRLHSLYDTDKALTVVGGASADGSAIALEAVSGKSEQLWKFERLPDGLLRISPKHAPNSVLDVYGAHTQNGSPVKLFHYYRSSEKNDGYAQRWVAVRVL
ncbi:MAG: RICIN domain-containing protein [Lysobacter sp.]|nr:RICIN domain-containing protein [Lysobacter sp.]